MAGLIQHPNGTYYAQFKDPHRLPSCKRISTKTKRKDVARRRFTKWETDYEKEAFTVPLLTRQTFFTTHGDCLTPLALLTALIFTTAAVLQPRLISSRPTPA